MDEEVRKIALTWNRFVTSLISAEEHWKELQEVVSQMNRAKLDELPSKGQQLISVYWRQNFLVMMPRFMDYFRAYGGLAETKMELPKEEPKKRGKEGKEE